MKAAMTTAELLTQLAKEPLPWVEIDPERVALLQAMQRMGHIRAHREQRDGQTVVVVEALTAGGRKIASGAPAGAARRLTTAFWAFRVHDADPGDAAKLAAPARLAGL